MRVFKKIGRAYQKTMAIRDYFVIYLRSAITKLNKKKMVIDRNKSCITIIATGSRQDRDDRGRIATIGQDRDDRAGSRRSGRIATIGQDRADRAGSRRSGRIATIGQDRDDRAGSRRSGRIATIGQDRDNRSRVF